MNKSKIYFLPLPYKQSIMEKEEIKRGDKVRFMSYESKNWRGGIFKKYIDATGRSVVLPNQSPFHTIATHVEKL